MNLDTSQPENNSPVAASGNLEELPEVKQLREKFLMITEISDPLTREYKFSLLEKEAEQIGLSSDSYRRLFETYLQNKIYIPQYPQKWWLLTKWINWFIKFPKKLKVGTTIFLILLEKGVLISLIVSLIGYYQEAPKRKQQAHYQAWEIINGAKDQTGSGGRIEALEELNKDKVNLNYTNLNHANLRTINLKNAQLAHASFIDADLQCDQRSKCSIITYSNLYQADFQNAKLSNIDLRNNNLINANFTRTYLQEAKLQNSDLNDANFQDAKLYDAKFKGADLENANFKDAIICGDIFDKSTKSKKTICAKFMGAKNLTATQIKSAKDWQNGCYDLSLRKELNLSPDNPAHCHEK